MTLTDNSISYYKLDETTGSVADEVSSLNGSNYGATRGSTGKINTAYYFDGSSFVAIPYDSLLNLGSAQSYSFWLKTTGVEAGIITRNPSLGKFAIYLQGSYLKVYVYDDTYNEVTINYDYSSYLTSDYNHIVITADGTDWKLYINGDLKQTVTSSAYFTKTSGNLNLGVDIGTRYLTGSLDELGIWDRALTSDEVTKLYNLGDGFAYPFLSIAQSTSIDFGNGTITQAKITIESTGDSLTTVQMTADGTNYEDVTSGTLHTFTNTGTDLRWKVEGSGTTISQIKIEDYH